HLDIGNTGQPGSAYYSDGIFTVSGSGTDIWSQADSFQYTYQLFTGDGTVIGRVTEIQNTDGDAKAGLMFRETLGPEAPNVIAFITPSSVAGFQSRAGTGDLSTYIQGIS